jgi:spore coat polysaccharide biosynthesis predicted glycosyltransferase SpsG
MDVKRGPILFRVDATTAGYEPLYQCLSFAAALQRRRRGTHFLSYLDPLSLAHCISRGNNDWHPAEVPMGEPGDLNATLAQVRRLNAAAVVLYGPAVDANTIKSIRAAGALAILFDHRSTATHPADMLVNPFAAPFKKGFEPHAGTQLLAGRKYAMVRGLYRRQRTIRAQEQPAPYRALVAFGDDDPADQTLQRTQELMKIDAVDKISVIMRTHHDRYEEMKEFAADSNSRVEIVTEVKEIMTRLVRGHFALTSGDSWSLEFCTTGVPQLLLPSLPHHVASAKQMDLEGVATYLGEASKVTFAQLKEAVEVLLDDRMERMTMMRCARNRVDGRGGDRVVNGMEIMLHSPARKMSAFAMAA